MRRPAAPHPWVVMKITEGLLGEHALSYALFDQVEAATDDAASLASSSKDCCRS